MRGQSGATAAALALAAVGAVRAQGQALEEPALALVEEAAMRCAGGVAADDASRLARARVAHWAPVLRAQYGVRDDDKSRRGEFRLAPLVEDDVGQSRAWAVVASWDFAQLIYTRDEAQLALAHVHLARVRQQAAAEAAHLYDERFRRRTQLRLAGAEPSRERAEALLALLRATAELDALTGGLYEAQLAQLDVQLAALEPQLTLESAPAPRAPATRAQPALSSPGLPPAGEGAPQADATAAAAPPEQPPVPTAIEEDQ